MFALVAGLTVTVVFCVGVWCGMDLAARTAAKYTAERLHGLGIPVGVWLSAGRKERP